MRAGAVARWLVRIVVGFGLLLVLAAALLWWWAGQEGSLQWLMQRVGQGGPVRSEGVTGALRGEWHIQHIVWERDGIRLEADDIRLRWQPIALIERTLQLDEVSVARARVIDTRPRKDEPLQEPAQLKLPWRVKVDSFKVGSLAYQGRVDVAGGGLDAHYAFDGLQHQLTIAALQLAGGAYRGDVSLLAVAPFTLAANVSGEFTAPVPGAKERVPLQLVLHAQGPARTIAAQASLRVADASVLPENAPAANVSAQVTPFATMPVPRATAQLRHIDAALFWPAAPRTQLSGGVEVTPAGKDAYRLECDLRNAAPGPWDQQRLPVASLRASGSWRSGTALVESLAARAGGGRVEGSGRWQGKGWAFEGRVADVDPAQLHTALASLPLTGPLKLSGEGRAIDFDVALRAAESHESIGGGLQLRDILAQGRWSGDTLALAQLRLRTNDALLQGEGEVQPQAKAGRGRVELQAPGLQVHANGSIAETRGQGTADIAANDLAQAQRWVARWPGAAGLLKAVALRGQGNAQVAWQGGWRDPTVQARATAQSLAWQAAAADTPTWLVRDATLQLQGRLRDAALNVRAQAAQGQRLLDLTANGRLGATLGAPMHWQGQVADLQARWQDPALTPGPWRIVLRQPVAWHASGGNFDVSAGEALLQAPVLRSGAPANDAVLTWGPLRRQAGVLTTSGRVANLPMAWIDLFGGTQLGATALSGDMVFDAQWNAQLGRAMRIEASIARVRGDVTVLAETAEGAAARVNAGVREARASISTQGDQVVLQLLWDSERAGHAEGDVRSRIVRLADGDWSWPENAPLAGHVRAQLPRIGVWSVLAPPGWRLRGSLTADIQVAGTRAQPELSGPVEANELALRSVVDGIELRNGRLRAQLAGRKVIVNEFLLHGSPEGGSDGGTLLAQGEASWTPHGPLLQAEAQLSQLRASIRTDRQLTVSGTVAARMERSGTSIDGKLEVDRARIQIPEVSPPRLAEDVVVHNAPGVPATDAERRARPPAAPGGNKLALHVTFDLGSDFRVTGRGLDTRLAGTAEIRNAADGSPEIVGVIRAVGGTYEAYGQRMNIERGELRFTGPPDNPALDILAVRPNMVQKVGVQVTGRAQSPHVELYSDSGLSEAETLSYVVLGRSSAGSGAETAMLQRAASALLAGRGGTGKTLAGSLGLDDLSVTPDGTNTAVVRVGKRFADNFYASYERSLSGAMGTLLLFYDVSKRVTVRAEAGERTGLDLILTFSFDKAGSGK